ncbi:MAG: hypothetical protein ACKESB_03450 [Candidatus Hodgkinia cicadicola]
MKCTVVNNQLGLKLYNLRAFSGLVARAKLLAGALFSMRKALNVTCLVFVHVLKRQTDDKGGKRVTC